MECDRIPESAASQSTLTRDEAHGAPDGMGPTRPGAHGLHLPMLAGAGDLLVQAPEQWMEWQVVLALGKGMPTEFVEDSRARLRSAPSGWVDLDRCQRTSTMHLPSAPSPGEIAQPFLGSTAVVVAHWAGLPSFHAGAFVAHGKAWAILGHKGRGKSSLLAALSLRGVPILTDDVLVVGKRLQGLAGPRCVDLRRETAFALGVGDAMGVVGTRERWRVRVDQVPPEVPLGGWIHLDWGEPEIASVSPEQRVEALFANFALRGERLHPTVLSQLMGLFALPMVRVHRPRDLRRIDETCELLCGYLAGVPV
jgi:hypothetical protein